MHGKARLRPWEIRRLTLAEVVLALEDNLEDTKPANATPFLSEAEMRAWAEWRRSMTPADRLAEAREKWGET